MLIGELKFYGLYFDGEGDCPCCGSRWSSQWSDENGTEEPTIYYQAIEDFLDSEKWNLNRADGVKTVLVQYMDGTKKEYD